MTGHGFRGIAPHFAEFRGRHIRDTVRQSDIQELTHQIELKIGPYLQYIRVNGALVGLDLVCGVLPGRDRQSNQAADTVGARLKEGGLCGRLQRHYQEPP